ncbi:MAG: VOC family protein [Phycisphaerales bacterium]
MPDYNSEKNWFVWMDIPVDDLGRACAFYEGVLGVSCQRESMGEIEFAVLSHEDGNGGCLVPREGEAPARVDGKACYGVPLVYLNCDGRIREASKKVSELGGTVLLDVHAIGPHGFRVLIEDSEGNYFALHSNTDA